MLSVLVQKYCRKCGHEFGIFPRDREFYERVGVPDPTLCPDCRQQRRIAHVNQLHLFRRKCGATGQEIISNYPPEGPYTVYSQPYWFSDAHDGTRYGRDFDFTRPFFEQFRELGYAAPRPALFTDFLHDENSAYTNYAGKNQSCYFIFDSDENRDCLYSYGMNSSRDTVDSYRVQKLDHCYETVDSTNCYGSIFIFNSENCSDSAFLNNCIGCRHSIMCSNLRNKEYHIENKPVSKEVYQAMWKDLGNYVFLNQKRQQFEDFRRRFPQKYMREVQCENSTGNYLVHCKNAEECYDCMNVWDGKFCTQMFMNTKNVMDTDEGGDGELMYECNNLGYNAYNLLFSLQSLDNVTNLAYCNLCFHCSDLFGCVGLRYKKYCILNKQYTKEEYEALKPRIIEHMKKTGEWGEYFPVELSAFPYNLTVAYDFFPLSREEVLKNGWDWYEEKENDFSGVTRKIPASKLPPTLADIPDDILNWAIECAESKKLFRIQRAELDFYRKMNLPIPREHFEVRHRRRMKQRNPRKLWSRECMKCKEPIQTTYAPERPETVYCEKCYLEAVL